MARGQRVLSVRFDDVDSFEREYQSNLANGGVFVASDEAFELRDRVRVELSLPFCDARLVLQGEVVHRVTAEMAQMGAPCGVAVQFDGPVHHVRAQLEPLREASGLPAFEVKDPGRRRSPRTEARVPARIDARAGEVAGHTRDLSQTGVLVSVPGKRVPVGETVRLGLSHPTSGESMEVDGIVVREVENDGGVSALAVEFTPEESERERMQRFVEAIQSAEHARRLGGITGDVSELGVPQLLQMFAASVGAGTLTVRHDGREGVIGFEGGLLRFSRLGACSGMKALARIMGWTVGTFEFHARLDAVEEAEAPLPFEAALLDGARLLDESNRIDRERFPAAATPCIESEEGVESLSKIEAAVLDLSRAGFSLRRIVDVVPEPDADVYRALEALRERGVLSF